MNDNNLRKLTPQLRRKSLFGLLLLIVVVLLPSYYMLFQHSKTTQAAGTTASAPTPNPIVKENLKPGTTSWQSKGLLLDASQLKNKPRDEPGSIVHVLQPDPCHPRDLGC